MSKKILALILGLGLAAMVFADLGFYISFNSSQRLKVFTSAYIADRQPAPAFADTLIMLSSFQPNRQEFLVFGNIISGENVEIGNGFWNTKKYTLGIGFGKVLTIPVELAKFDAKFCLDFSAGPFAYVFLSNLYTHVSGQRKPGVEEASIFKRVQYGLYADARLRLVHFKKVLNQLAVSLGFHFFMPFSNHEYNDDASARYHLFKSFAYAGISF